MSWRANRLSLALPLSLIFVVGFAAQASAVYSPRPTLIGSTSPCQNVVWVGAEGSGQTYAQWNGLGDQVREGLDAYASHLDEYRIGYFPVPYPAMGVPDVDVLLLNGSVRKQYFDSVDAGVKETLLFLRTRYQACPHEHYVLSGYSQGAMVMHRTLAQVLDDASLAGSLLPRVDGVLAIADGDRYARQGGSNYGTARPDGYGISWSSLAKGIRYTYRPVATIGTATTNWSPSRFHSVCDAGDLVCDYNHTSVTDGVRIHSYDYAPGGDGVVFVDSAATNIAKSTRLALPPVTAGNTTLPDAVLNSFYATDLDRTLTSGSGPYEWTLLSSSDPGITVTPSGILNGAFSTSGPATVVVNVVDDRSMTATITYSLTVQGLTSTRVTVGGLTLNYPTSQWSGVSQPMGNDSNALDLTNDAARVYAFPGDCASCSPTVHADLQVFPGYTSEAQVQSSLGPSLETVAPIVVGGVTSTWQGRYQEIGLPAGQTALIYSFADKNLTISYRRAWGEGWVYPSPALTTLLGAGVWSG